MKQNTSIRSMPRQKLLIALPFLLLMGCSNGAGKEKPIDGTTIAEDFGMKLIIDEKEIPINWYENDSVEALRDLSPMEIQMTRYGGFEQVGPIGQTIVSGDKRITTEPGDVVLYDSENIVVFFGSNTWSYTKLGHINLNEAQLSELLNKESVILKLE